VSAASNVPGLPITFSSSTPTTCTISNGVVSYLAVGTCTIVASQAGDVNYNAASAQQSFTIGIGVQTLTFLSTPPGQATIGVSYQVSAVSSSTLPVFVSVEREREREKRKKKKKMCCC
jgi:hypothetical protein